jgi:hypothetical protein
MMEIEADDRRPQRDPPRPPRQVEREQERSRQVGVVMVLREPGMAHAQLVGQANQVGHLVENRARGLIARPFEVVGQTDREHAQGLEAHPGGDFMSIPA